MFCTGAAGFIFNKTKQTRARGNKDTQQRICQGIGTFIGEEKKD